MVFNHLVDHEYESFSVDSELLSEDWSLGGIIIYVSAKMRFGIESKDFKRSF